MSLVPRAEPAGSTPGATTPGARREHWESVWSSRQPDEVSWYQREPRASLAMIDSAGLACDDPILDVGGGASTLVDRLLERGFRDLSVLDVSAHVLELAAARLGDRAAQVRWIASDILDFTPTRAFALWHDRAVFHFLVEPEDRRRYTALLERAVRDGGHVVLATFAADGPTRCSGLPTARYSIEELCAELGPAFRLVSSSGERHSTPSGAQQSFLFAHFQKQRREGKRRPADVG